LSGLANGAVLRLRKTREKIGKQTKAQLATMEQEMDIEGSYKNYRMALEKTDLPAIPHL